MVCSARLFNCARCHCQVVLCSHCDRGQIYCGGPCALAARRQCARAAARRYQHSRRGRLKHAERQRRYRHRVKVTHQGSPPPPLSATLPPESKPSGGRPAEGPQAAAEAIRCHRCGRACQAWLRQAPLRRRPAPEAIITWPTPRRRQGHLP